MILKLIGLCILLGCLVLIYFFESSTQLTGAFKVFHWPAMNLTFMGPIGLVLFSVEFKALKNTLKKLLMSPSRKKKNYDKNLDTLTAITPKFYSSGSKALSMLSDSKNQKIYKLVDRLSMKIPLSDVKNMMIIEKDKDESHLNQAIGLLGLGIKYSPSIGMLGTILGMVQLLSSISDPSQIGSHMALALLTTFYGLFFSLALWSPFQHRLQSLRDVEIDFQEHLIHWVDLMEKRKPAHYFEEVSGDKNTRK